MALKFNSESLLHRDSDLKRERSPSQLERKGQEDRSADSAYPAQSVRLKRPQSELPLFPDSCALAQAGQIPS